MQKPRVLLWDVETTHNLVAVFRLFGEDYIPHDNIIRERYIVCAAWKWLGESRISSASTLSDRKLFAKDPHNDLAVCKALHAVLSKADVIVAHNGDKYDIKFTEARLLFHGLAPLPPIAKIDTLKTAKARFLFNSNRLDYLGQFLGVGKKQPTRPGLWLRVLNGEIAAIREMVAYNKQDVALLERVFTKLAPYMSNHVNHRLFGGSGCPRCGSSRTQARGAQRSAACVYQRYQCVDCGGWFRDAKAAKALADARML